MKVKNEKLQFIVSLSLPAILEIFQTLVVVKFGNHSNLRGGVDSEDDENFDSVTIIQFLFVQHNESLLITKYVGVELSTLS